MPTRIGTLAERSLHASLKAHYAQPGDEIEFSVEGFVVDIVRGDRLIEIQTGSFSPLKAKFIRLLNLGYQIHLVHPIPARKWIVKEDLQGQQLERRRSPRRGKPADIFYELVRIPHLLAQPGFSLEIVLTEQEEIRRDDGRGSWRRGGWSVSDHRLLAMLEQQSFIGPEDYLRFLPPDINRPFSVRDLAAALKIDSSLAQKMAYTLHKAGWLERDRQKGRAYLYG